MHIRNLKEQENSETSGFAKLSGTGPENLKTRENAGKQVNTAGREAGRGKGWKRKKKK